MSWQGSMTSGSGLCAGLDGAPVLPLAALPKPSQPADGWLHLLASVTQPEVDVVQDTRAIWEWLF